MYLSEITNSKVHEHTGEHGAHDKRHVAVTNFEEGLHLRVRLCGGKHEKEDGGE